LLRRLPCDIFAVAVNLVLNAEILLGAQ
jgi:hypothetical protein